MRYDTQLHVNSRASTSLPYGASQREILNRAAFVAAQSEITSWPGYAPTPLIPLPGLAGEAGVADVWCKHEGARFGLGSFKPTGPTFAMLAVLKAEVKARAGVEVGTQDLLAGRHAQVTANIVVSAATSGNHGRALAWGATLFGCQAVLYMNDGVSAGRAAAIEAHGGQVVRVPGAYEQVVTRLYEDADRHGHIVVGDPGTERYPKVSRDIMQGYAMVVDELMGELDPVRPTHIFVPGGGGIMAAATCGHLWEGHGKHRPRLIVVEPTASCCLYESARQGQHVKVDAAVSVMDGLVVEEPAADALSMLLYGAFAFLTVPDQAAVVAMRQAVKPSSDDPPLVIGDTGSAAWAGLISVMGDASRRQALQAEPDSRVAIIVTEGATDPAVYRSITGVDANQVSLPEENL
jgi:diaminopropionate ammonia-lyase